MTIFRVWRNRLAEILQEKTCFAVFATKQTLNPRSLISTICVHYLDITILIVPLRKISSLAVCVTEQGGLYRTWW